MGFNPTSLYFRSRLSYTESPWNLMQDVVWLQIDNNFNSNLVGYFKRYWRFLFMIPQIFKQTKLSFRNKTVSIVELQEKISIYSVTVLDPWELRYLLHNAKSFLFHSTWILHIHNKFLSRRSQGRLFYVISTCWKVVSLKDIGRSGIRKLTIAFITQ